MGWRIGALGVLLAVALGGCGGSSNKSSSSSTSTTAQKAAKAAPTSKAVQKSAGAATATAATVAPAKAKGATPRGVAPEPAESLSDALTAFRQATASGKCEDLLPLEHSAERGDAAVGAAPSPEECANKASMIDRLKGQVPVANERFGPAAVIDYDRNGQDLTGLWLLEADGRWRFLNNGMFLAHSVGSRPAQSDAFDEGANGFLGAAQSKDCNAMYRFLNANSPFAVGRTQDQWCSFVTPLYDQQFNFFNLAGADQAAKAQVLGKTRLYGIYDVDFDNRSYWILIGTITPGNTPPEQTQGHVADGFQAMYSGSFRPS
jgi:hypothetical protein